MSIDILCVYDIIFLSARRVKRTFYVTAYFFSRQQSAALFTLRF
jgi:hypothetical protein